jgi:glycosyltransferase involved in cell wall biosynthesis
MNSIEGRPGVAASRDPADFLRDRVVLLVGIRGYGIAQSRTALIRSLTARGASVLIFANRDASAAALDGLVGVEFIDAGFGRRLIAPIADVRAMFRLAGLLRRRSPALIHFFNSKPTLLGLLAVRATGSNAIIVNTITGLGHTFTMNSAVRTISGWLYRLLLRFSQVTIFQNPDHAALFRLKGYVDVNRAELIAGSGVDTERYRPASNAAGEPRPLTVLMAARLLRTKGVPEFVDAAKRVQAEAPGLRFLLAGEIELQHPDGMNEAALRRAAIDAGVEYLGYRTDLDRLLPRVDLVVLPTYYHEGLPRILVEAAACGVPAVTTDWPGCRDAVENGVTGLLVPPRDVAKLADAILSLARNAEMRRRMGSMARQRAVQFFDVQGITSSHLRIYERLLTSGGTA